MAPIPTLQTPPGTTKTPYVLPCYTGELWTIPTSNSTMRLLVTGSETNNAFAVIGTGGTFDKPIGFHYHNEAHDVFLCLKGTINVWAEDKARSLGPGDFASVPPTTIHQYQIASLHTEFLGLIIPGGWEEFFRFIGEPYTGPLFPTNDKRNPFEVLIPKLMAATEKFDMVPVREKASYDPQPWDGSENVLPGTCERGGYFLKADSGPKYIAGGAIVTPLATRKETSGKFSCYSIEASSLHSDKGFKETLKFSETHHAVQTVEGVMGIIIDGEVVKASAGETIFIPAGTGFKFVAESKFAKMYVFANGGGIGEALQTVGEHCTSSMVPEEKDLKHWDSTASKALKALEKELGFSTV